MLKITKINNQSLLPQHEAYNDHQVNNHLYLENVKLMDNVFDNLLLLCLFGLKV